MISKDFDAVKLMRDLRDQLSQKYVTMNLQEEIADLHNSLSQIPWKKRKNRGHDTSAPNQNMGGL